MSWECEVTLESLNLSSSQSLCAFYSLLGPFVFCPHLSILAATSFLNRLLLSVSLLCISSSRSSQVIFVNHTFDHIVLWVLLWWLFWLYPSGIFCSPYHLLVLECIPLHTLLSSHPHYLLMLQIPGHPVHLFPLVNSIFRDQLKGHLLWDPQPCCQPWLLLQKITNKTDY